MLNAQKAFTHFSSLRDRNEFDNFPFWAGKLLGKIRIRPC